MSKLTSVLKSWLGSLLGLIALAYLIYFLGPAVGIRGIHPLSSELYRYLLISLLVIFWVSWQGWNAWLVYKKNQQMLNQLVKSTVPEASSEEVATREELDQLSSNLQEALKSLEKAKQAQGKVSCLTELPWYIIIGPPGSGKTTLLANSGLNFPLSDKYGKDAIRGVGGTRYCDWWFTDNAILIDTAGRYTTQDSQQNIDQAAWLGFLNILKQYRGHQPINGILVAVSLTDLLQQPAELQNKHAKAIRQRIQELYVSLEIKFPVYMLFTKADLMAGFAEFFEDLDKSSREQVWGMTFPYNTALDQVDINQFIAEFELLNERLNQQIIIKIDKERSAERRRAIYLFPQQFNSLKLNLQSFLEKIYQINRYEQPILLRGIYFTSATQEGVPIDRIMVSLANSFGVKPQQVNRFSAQGKSFFISHLLSQVIFKEAGLTGHNLALERKLQWIKGLALVSAIVLAIIAIILWTVSYWYNRQLQTTFMTSITKVQQQVAVIPENDLGKVLNALDQMQELAWEVNDSRPNIFWLARLGLNQEITLRRGIDDKYVELLKNSLNPQIKKILENKIINSLHNPQQVSALFGYLKIYLLLGGEGQKNIKPTGFLNLDWNNNGRIDTEDNRIAIHTKNLLRLGSATTLKKGLVDEARKSLLQTQLSKLSYISFVQREFENAKIYDFMILNKKGLNNINQSFQKKSKKAWVNNVPGFFTKQGYEAVFLHKYQQAAESFTNETWILGEHIGNLQDSKQLADDYKKYYQEEYISAWEGFLQDLTPQTVTNSQSAKAILIGLTSNESNMLFRLMEEITKQTDFSPIKSESLISFSKEFTIEPLILVDAHFKSIHEWTNEERFQRINQLINEIYAKLSQPNVFNQIDNNTLTNALGELKGEANKLPSVLKNLVVPLANELEQQVHGQIQGVLRKQLASNLKKQLGDFCQSRLAKKYPLVANASTGVNLADFSDFFASRGLVNQFKETYLQSDVADEFSLNQVREQLARTEPITKAFFPIDNLRFSYSLKVVNLAPKFKSLHLSTGIQNQVFKNGDIKSFNWPDGDEIVLQGELPSEASIADPLVSKELTASSTAFSFAPTLQVLVSEKSDEWLIFRLFEKKKWIVPGVAEMQLISKPNSPFQVVTKELRSFKCPTL